MRIQNSSDSPYITELITNSTILYHNTVHWIEILTIEKEKSHIDLVK